MNFGIQRRTSRSPSRKGWSGGLTIGPSMVGGEFREVLECV